MVLSAIYMTTSNRVPIIQTAVYAAALSKIEILSLWCSDLRVSTDGF